MHLRPPVAPCGPLRCRGMHGKCNGRSGAFFMVLTCTFDTNISSIFLRAPQYPTVRNASLHPIALGSPDTQCTPGSPRTFGSSASCKEMVCTPSASLHLRCTTSTPFVFVPLVHYLFCTVGAQHCLCTPCLYTCGPLRCKHDIWVAPAVHIRQLHYLR